MGIGFTSFNAPSVPSVPTTAEIVASLTNDQKVAILNGFAKKVLANRLKYQIDVPKVVIVHLYRKIDEIEERSRSLMRGEILITPAVIDPESGEVTTSAVYNTPPSTSTQLKNQIKVAFADDFTEAQVTAILTKMVKCSKFDETGDWSYYSINIIL